MKKHGKKKHQGITEQQHGGLPEVEVIGGLRPAKYGIKAWKPRGTRDVTKNHLHVDKKEHILINPLYEKIRGCGSRHFCKSWYDELPDAVKVKVSDAGFGEFVKVLGDEFYSRKRTILRALADRWWDTTHTFHFDEIGELTMTPSDFSSITGLPVSGKPLEYDMDAHKKRDELIRWFGEPMVDIAKKRVTFLELYGAYKGFGGNKMRAENVERLTRVFILALLCSTLLCDKAGVAYLYYMPNLKDLSSIALYNWGGAGLSCLYKNMDALVRGNQSTGGYWRAWEVWACEYIKPIAKCVNRLGNGRIYPAAMAWGTFSKKVNYIQLKGTLRKLRRKDVNMHPWGKFEDLLPTYAQQSSQSTRSRILLDGPCGYAWYLGERVTVQSLGLSTPRVPKVPPASMLGDYPITKDEAKLGLRGIDANNFLETDGGPERYKEFVRRHIKFTSYPADQDELNPNSIGRVDFPPWQLPLMVRKDNRFTCQQLQIPKDCPYIPVPEHIKFVPVDQVKEFLAMISGMTQVIMEGQVDKLQTTAALKPDVVTSKTPMDESDDSSWKPEPYEVSEGSSPDDSLDGWLVSEEGESAETEEARHQSGDLGTESVEEEQLSHDKGDDNVGMEDEDIADEFEQVSDTHMIDLEPIPSGPSNENEKRAQKPKKRKQKIPTTTSDENQLEAPNPKKKKGIQDSDAGNDNLRQVPKPKKTKGNVDSDAAAKENPRQVQKPKKTKGNLDTDLAKVPKPIKKSKDIVQGEPNDNLKQSPKPKKSKDIVKGADPNDKVRKPDNGNTTKVVTPRKSSRLLASK